MFYLTWNTTLEMYINNTKIRNVIICISILRVLSRLKNHMTSVVIQTAQIKNNQDNHTMTNKCSLTTWQKMSVSAKTKNTSDNNLPTKNKLKLQIVMINEYLYEIKCQDSIC